MPAQLPADLVVPGHQAPDFELSDQAGKSHRLQDCRDRWVVLYFYPKDSTPGCTLQACQFRDHLDDFSVRQAAVFGVSPDSQASHEKFAAKRRLPFPLLSDIGSKVCTAYGVWQSKSMFGRTYMGVVRTTYLIRPDGAVAHVWPKVKVPGHAMAVLKILDSFMGS